MYKDVWEAAVGEVLICEREPDNASNRYTILTTKTSRFMVHKCICSVPGIHYAFTDLDLLHPGDDARFHHVDHQLLLISTNRAIKDQSSNTREGQDQVM